MAKFHNTGKSFPKTSEADETRSWCTVAALVRLEEYDFGNWRGVLNLGDGREARISIDDIVVHGVVAPAHGTRVRVDGEIEGNLILATPHWYLIQPTTSVIPIAVAPTRVSLADN